MSLNSYFSQLRQEFKNDPYRDRFLSELEDHADDLAEHENLTEKNLTPHFMKTHFGDPKQVKKIFNAVVRPWENLFFILEGLFYGIMMLFFSLMGTDLIQGFVSNEFFLNPFVFILFVAWFFIYLLAFRRYLIFQKTSKSSLLLWIFLVAGPTFIHGLLYLADGASLNLSIYPELSYLNPQKVMWIAGLFFAGHGALGLLSWMLQNAEEKKGQFRPPAKFTQQFRSFLFIYILAFILFRTLGSYFGFPFFNGSNWAWLMTLFSPLIFVEYLFFFFFSATFRESLFLSLYMPAMLMGFLAVVSLLALFRQKTWRSRRTLVVLYVFSFLFMSPQAFTINPDYTVPHTSLSQIVEKEKVGWLYAPMKYLNSDEGIFFHYTIGITGDYFYLKQNTGDIFYVNQKDLGKNNLKKMILTQAPPLLNADKYVSLMNFFSERPLICEKIAGDLIFNSLEEERQAPTEKITLEKGVGWPTCQKLFLNEQLISNSPLNIRNWFFSEDGNWLLLHLQKGAYDPEEVHLLDLRQI